MRVADTTKKAVKETVDRVKAPKNSFWKTARMVGLGVTAIGTILAFPFAPAALAAWSGYLIAVGGTITGMAQVTKK